MKLAERIQNLRRVTGGSLECGWMCDEVALFLHSLVRFYRPDVVIQTGHLWGKSACAILEAFGTAPLETMPQDGDKNFAAFVESHRPKPLTQRLISVDPHPIGVPRLRAGIEWLRQVYYGKFEFVKERSDAFFAAYQLPDGARLMGMVDGDHSDDGCRSDLDALANLKASVIVVDDTCWLPSLLDVSRDFAVRRGYSLQQHNTYNGIAVLTHG